MASVPKHEPNVVLLGKSEGFLDVVLGRHVDGVLDVVANDTLRVWGTKRITTLIRPQGVLNR